ncbi:MAG: 6,7-dimethyl-8-ribityllumazine synthase [Spirochaetes bacterium GWF1_49_6]|nr:MAG: 6,7-dimethyl-8-ribityllumazine synthase [Spirochaetes bacterium GWF1_49_6]
MKTYEGKLDAAGLKIGVILGKFNSFVGDRLVEGAKDAFYQLGGKDENMDVYRVPGAYEIAGVARKLMQAGKHDALICVGVIIQGETPHFDYVAGNSAKAIMELSSEGGIPVVYGIVTAGDLEQAIDRAGVKMGNKGYTSLMTAVEMANLYKDMK